MADEDDFVVLPNRFVDGWSGREVKPGFNGLPRINCVAGGKFQVDLDLDDLVVRPNGFSRVGLPTTTHPNGEQTFIDRNAAGGTQWPPSWWPSRRAGPNDFAPGVPTGTPDWEEEPEEPDEHEDLSANITGTRAPLGEARDAPPRRPAPRTPPRR